MNRQKHSVDWVSILLSGNETKMAVLGPNPTPGILVSHPSWLHVCTVWCVWLAGTWPRWDLMAVLRTWPFSWVPGTWMRTSRLRAWVLDALHRYTLTFLLAFFLAYLPKWCRAIEKKTQQNIYIRDAKGYCFHLPVNRSHLPVNYRLTDQQKKSLTTNVNGIIWQWLPHPLYLTCAVIFNVCITFVSYIFIRILFDN